MKLKNLLFLSLLVGSLNLTAQTNDADYYWILEDFSAFTVSDNWITGQAEYQTYPNSVKISTVYANVEASSHCAAHSIPGGNQFRIRGLADGGYFSFTAPNASRVKIYVSGKSDLEDRFIKIYRNDILIQYYENVDRTICCQFVDHVNSQEPVTYKVTAGTEGSTDPVVVYYVEVLKYGMEDPSTDKDIFWIKEDFSQFTSSSSYILSETDYPSYPNNINLTTTYANVEENGDCARANKGYGNQMRIRGLSDDGSLRFTLPDAGVVRIHVTGKSSLQDRTIRIYRNDQLVKTYEKMDNDVCRIFTDEVFSQEAVTYKITGGTETSTSPIAVYYIEAEKYYEKPEPGNSEAYWIREDFTDYPIETGYSIGFYESFPNNIALTSTYSNVEWGEGCTVGSNILRVSGKAEEMGALEFSVPDFSEVIIGVTGKSNNRDREALIYMNDELVQTFSSMDRDVCMRYHNNTGSQSETRFKITGSANNLEKPVAIDFIDVVKYGYTSITQPQTGDKRYAFYPNPVHEMLYFKGEKAVNEVNLYDLSGRRVLSERGVFRVNVSGLDKGVYIVKIDTGDEIISGKLIKN